MSSYERERVTHRVARVFLIEPGVEVVGVVIDFDAHGYHLNVRTGTRTRLQPGNYSVPLHNVAYVSWGEADG